MRSYPPRVHNDVGKNARKEIRHRNQGPHVPFYVKVGSVYTRCRPYRKTVQFCRACYDFGHRQDVCPNPNRNLCDNCGVENPQEDHECQPKCKLCGMPHVTAS